MALNLFFFSLSISFFSSSLSAAEKSIDDFGQMVETITRAQGEVAKTGALEAPCVNCIASIEPDQLVALNDKVLDLGRPLIYKDNVPYTIQLKRSKSSPLRTTLQFKNGHSECGKMFVESNPWVSNGPLVMGCSYYMTVYEDNEIELDLKDLPLPLNEEEQIIEIKITKPKSRNSFYSLEASVLKGPSAIINKSKKFWGNGHKLDFQGNP